MFWFHEDGVGDSFGMVDRLIRHGRLVRFAGLADAHLWREPDVHVVPISVRVDMPVPPRICKFNRKINRRKDSSVAPC